MSVTVSSPVSSPVSSTVSSPVLSVVSSEVSDRKVNANRLNAQRSTGPRTAEGKARAAVNALNHGFFSAQVLLPGEDAAEFDELRRGMHASATPSNTLERALVEQIVAASWKLRRLQLAEKALYTLRCEKHGKWVDDATRTRLGVEVEELAQDTKGEWVLRKPELPAHVLMALMLDDRADELMKHQLYQQRLEGSMHRALRQLEKMKNRKDRGSKDSGSRVGGGGSEVDNCGSRAGGGGSETGLGSHDISAEPGDSQAVTGRSAVAVRSCGRCTPFRDRRTLDAQSRDGAARCHGLGASSDDVMDGIEPTDEIGTIGAVDPASNLRIEPTAAPHTAPQGDRERCATKRRIEPTAVMSGADNPADTKLRIEPTVPLSEETPEQLRARAAKLRNEAKFNRNPRTRRQMRRLAASIERVIDVDALLKRAA